LKINHKFFVEIAWLPAKGGVYSSSVPPEKWLVLSRVSVTKDGFWIGNWIY
jgi:hypothetical protein